jgi:multiple sugar transport system substrate-binding protein
MMFDGPWSIQYTKENAPKVAADLGVVPLPASASAPSRTGSTYIDANAQVIPTGAKHAKAAFDFIKWETTNAKETATFSDTVGNIPQLADTPSFTLAQDPLFAEYIDIAKSDQARSWKQSATSSNYGTQLCQAQDDVLLNGGEPASALEAVSGS